MVSIKQIAKKYNLKIIEDSAHAIFTEIEGNVLGTIGDVGCFSFFSNKNITCGEGGACVTNNESLGEKIRLLRSHGMNSLTIDRYKNKEFSYDVVVPGYNYRMDEIRAALLNAQLEQLPTFLKKRRSIFLSYAERLANTPVTIPFVDYVKGRDWNNIAIHIFPVLLPDATNREKVIDVMKKHGIQTSLHYPCIHKFKAYSNGGQSLPLTENLSARILTLPFYPNLSNVQIEHVVGALNEALTGH